MGQTLIEQRCDKCSAAFARDGVSGRASYVERRIVLLNRLTTQMDWLQHRWAVLLKRKRAGAVMTQTQGLAEIRRLKDECAVIQRRITKDQHLVARRCRAITRIEKHIRCELVDRCRRLAGHPGAHQV